MLSRRHQRVRLQFLPMSSWRDTLKGRPAMTENDEHTHDDDTEARTCPVHDPSGHWRDDFQYVRPDVAASDDDNNHISDIAELLTEFITIEGNVPIYRFALAYVNAATGLIQIVTDPGMSEFG